MMTLLVPLAGWARPQPGWIFVHGPVDRCSGKTSRCAIDKVENGTVFWNADTEDAARGNCASPLFMFAQQVARGELF
ncbi:hypothetical protein, partial [Streptomyces sp. NPDC059816]|uniref:hypothetical protein n=1 Tax=Streptomyces sp. NPDC059816 TaxID=3346960 RepID=UPI0036620B7E